MNFSDRIVRYPQICNGQPIIKDTRVLLRTILACLAKGRGFEEILRDFPTLSEDDLRAIVAFAASSAQDDLPIAGAPAGP